MSVIRIRILSLLLLASALCTGRDLIAQGNWENMGFVPGPQPNRGSAAYFFNANEGLVGTGNFVNSYLARIYYTTDGGKSWTSSLMPNMNVSGQVTDIWFRDRMNGWATLTESAFTGWSGLYRSVDGGKSWKLVRQSQSPVSVRQNSRGVFFTDRGSGGTGIIYSADTGKTFTLLVVNSAPLAIEFMNDKDGYVTSETGGTAPHMRTTNYGEDWTPITNPNEAWGVFADPKTKAFVYASEKDGAREPTSSGIDRVLTDGRVDRKWNGAPNGISGGIAGYVGCNTTMYVQGQGSGGQNGLLRSTDGGLTWVSVGGPSNGHDTRFAVTGKGAVVYAFDQHGGMFRTFNGGDGALKASVRENLILKTVFPSRLKSRECDSTVIPIEMILSACDTAKVIKVEVLEDTLNEIVPLTQSTRNIAGTIRDTLMIRYRPQQLGPHVFRVRIEMQHPDGYIEDTILELSTEGLPSAEIFTVSELTDTKTIDFGKLNICTGDSIRIITLKNFGCGTLNVSNITINPSAFDFRSRVGPISLSPGDERKYLLRFRPRTLGPHSSMLYFHTRDGIDSIRLIGEGVPGQRGLALTQPPIASTTCDSVEVTLKIRNTSCGEVKIATITSTAPINVLGFTSKTLPSDSSTEVTIRFVPNTPGVQNFPLNIDGTIGSDNFDTVLNVSTTASSGDLVLTVANTLDFDSVSTCSQLMLPIVLKSEGCATVLMTGSAIDGTDPEFTITQNIIDFSLAKGETDTIWITFKPSNVGTFTKTLRIMSSAGERTVTLTGYGTDDQGEVVLAFNSTLQTELCTHQDFNIRIANGTCDDVTIDSFLITGDVQDFIFPDLGAQGIKVGDAFDLFGQFQPTATGLRRIVVRVYYTDPFGTHFKEIEITAIGTSSPPLFASLPPDSTMRAMILSDLTMPVYVRGISNSDIQAVEFSLRLKTDLLTPVSVNLASTELDGATLTQFDVSNDSVSVRIEFNPPRRMGEGILARVNFRTFITDTLSTSIELIRFSAAGSAAKCLVTSVQSIGQWPVFTLDPDCGDQYISDKMAGKIVSIASIRPNPSKGKIKLDLEMPVDIYDAVVSIYDANGRVVLERAITSNSMELEIPGSAGQYFVRVHSAAGSSTRSIAVRK